MSKGIFMGLQLQREHTLKINCTFMIQNDAFKKQTEFNFTTDLKQDVTEVQNCSELVLKQIVSNPVSRSEDISALTVKMDSIMCFTHKDGKSYVKKSMQVFSKLQQHHVFPGTLSWLLWISHKPHCQQFFFFLFFGSTSKPLKSLSSQDCRVCRVTMTLFLERDAAGGFLNTSSNALRTKTYFSLSSVNQGEGRNFNGDVSKFRPKENCFSFFPPLFLKIVWFIKPLCSLWVTLGILQYLQ